MAAERRRPGRHARQGLNPIPCRYRSHVLTLASLIAAGIAPTQARAFADPLAAACALHAIDTPARLAGFVAQCRVESADFTRLEESMYYRTPERIRQVFPSRVRSTAAASKLARNPKALALAVYSGRLGNGGPETGDGWRFIGRGVMQLTGRANYAEAASALGRSYLEDPGLVALPSDAALTAAWFWAARGCNALADAGEWDAITRRINGPAMLKADTRRQYTEEALAAFA